MCSRRALPTYGLITLFLLTIGSHAGYSQEQVPLSISEVAAGFFQQESFVRHSEPEWLTYEELKHLSKYPQPKDPKLKAKLNAIWTTPIIHNEAYYSGAKPHRPHHVLLGDYFRVITWNIEKSLHIQETIDLLTAHNNKFNTFIDFKDAAYGSREHTNLTRQWERLHNADLIVLQEMEIGIKRSGYKNAAAELAEALNMNYAYGTQYLEVDPVILGVEKIEMEDGSEDLEAEQFYRVDPEKYKGAFGSAILSRYPVKHVELRPLEYQPYDWYDGEKEKISFLEAARRVGTKTAFKNELTREMKVGGRHYFRIDLHVPDLPNETLTVINVHLEIKCEPKDRERQMREILSYIQTIKNPLIMLGDFNAAPTDISPTSVGRVVKRTAKNPSAWLGVALHVAGSQLNAPRVATNLIKNFNDPFAADIPVVGPNPVKDMFVAIQDFRFNDGQVFDFRGDAERSIGGKSGLLANSNQRGTKGFKTSFSVKRPWGIIGKYRLDWIFVKRPLETPEDPDAPYQFSPHFGETLEELNTSLLKQISDHHPSVIDLPFEEPKI